MRFGDPARPRVGRPPILALSKHDTRSRGAEYRLLQAGTDGDLAGL
jgi:hypothetical protein